MRLEKRNALFIKQIKDTHGVDAVVQDRISEAEVDTEVAATLCFITQHMRSQGDIVLSNDIHTAALVEEQKGS